MKSNCINKRITLLLAAVFAWLFVGSLIIFHQEHVLGKHSRSISHHFIVPKQKDESGYQVKHLTAAQKINLFAGDVLTSQHAGEPVLPEGMDRLTVSPSGVFSEHPPRMIHGLRAPPAA